LTVPRRDRVEHKHFRAPTFIPVIGAIVCGFLATPLAGRPVVQYQIAGILLIIGVVLWAITALVNRKLDQAAVDLAHLTSRGPIN
jgi:4-amino-4-deoxy-L-arabinose transferase-like glycosyltransferase